MVEAHTVGMKRCKHCQAMIVLRDGDWIDGLLEAYCDETADPDTGIYDPFADEPTQHHEPEGDQK